MSNVKCPESQGAQPKVAALVPHRSISDELCRLELAVCKINALYDRILGNDSDLSDEGVSAAAISLDDFLHNTPDRLVKITIQIENYVSDIEKTLFS
jgi:hypothetical protein